MEIGKSPIMLSYLSRGDEDNALVAFKCHDEIDAKRGNAILGCIVGFFPLFGKRARPLHIKAEFLLSTATCASLALAGLYMPGLPHPHVDPTFITATTAMVGAAVGCKGAAFVWYVWPATFGAGEDLLSA